MHNTDDLIMRFLTGVASEDENQFLLQWIKNSAHNREYFNKFRDIWLASSQVPLYQQFSSLKSFRGQSAYSELQIKTIRSNRFLKELAKIAAVFVFAFLAGAVGYRAFTGKSEIALKGSKPVTVESGRGAMSSVILPDGSKAWLNAESKITYGNNYNNSVREIELTGEAYFDVKTNPARPFVVKAGNLTIKAFGTSFNVKAYPEDKFVATTLVRGKVIIEGKDNKNKNFKVDLKPNETVTYYADQLYYMAVANEMNATDPDKYRKIKPMQTQHGNLLVIKQEQVKTELFTSWKDKDWVIEQQNLGNLTRELERRYNIRIEFSSENIKKYRFSGTFQNETIEQIMYILHNTLPLNYTMEKGKVVIDEDKTMMKEFNR